MKFTKPLLPVILTFTIISCGSDPVNHLPGMDPWMDGNPGEFAKYAASADDGPVTMLNLLKFRDQSKDGDGTGAEAYARYAALAGPYVQNHGGSLTFSASAAEHLVGDTDYDWDAVLLVTWPKRQNLLDLGSDEGYQEIAHHRTNGLERTMLIALNQNNP